MFLVTSVIFFFDNAFTANNEAYAAFRQSYRKYHNIKWSCVPRKNEKLIAAPHKKPLFEGLEENKLCSSLSKVKMKT